MEFNRIYQSGMIVIYDLHPRSVIGTSGGPTVLIDGNPKQLLNLGLISICDLDAGVIIFSKFCLQK